MNFNITDYNSQKFHTILVSVFTGLFGFTLINLLTKSGSNISGNIIGLLLPLYLIVKYLCQYFAPVTGKLSFTQDKLIINMKHETIVYELKDILIVRINYTENRVVPKVIIAGKDGSSADFALRIRKGERYNFAELLEVLYTEVKNVKEYINDTKTFKMAKKLSYTEIQSIKEKYGIDKWI